MQNYYLYIDECGDHNLKNYDEQFPIFTLCGVIVREDRCEWLENEIHALKDEFWGNQHTILHSRDIRKCQRGFEILFDLEVKKHFYERINRILGTADVYTIVACAILKESYIRNYGRLNDVYAQSLTFVLERAVFYLSGLQEEPIEMHTIVEMRGKKEDERLRSFYNQLLDTNEQIDENVSLKIMDFFNNYNDYENKEEKAELLLSLIEEMKYNNETIQKKKINYLILSVIGVGFVLWLLSLGGRKSSKKRKRRKGK